MSGWEFFLFVLNNFIPSLHWHDKGSTRTAMLSYWDIRMIRKTKKRKIQIWRLKKVIICRSVRYNQRIFMYKELTAAPFVVSTSVFCCRKPEAIRKTTPEPLLAEWWTILYGVYTAQSVVWGVHYRVSPFHTLKKNYVFACFAQLT